MIVFLTGSKSVCWMLQKAILKTSEFGVRKCLSMEKVPAWEDGGTYRSSNPSPEDPELRTLSCWRKGEKDGKEVIDDLGIWAPAGIRGSVRNLEISLFLVWVSWPLLIWVTFSAEVPFWQGAVLPKTQFSSRIPCMCVNHWYICIKSCLPEGLKAVGKMQARIKTESQRLSISLLHNWEPP